MLYWTALVLLTTTCVGARTFNNPILSDQSYYNPGAIKVNGTYYVIADTFGISKGIFPIHTSTDLVEWKSAGFVFNGSNIPTWAREEYFDFPDIQQVGDNFLVYFSAISTTSSYYHIGVAIAEHPLGPYTSIDQPIVAQDKVHSYTPSIIKDEDKLYLVWSDRFTEIKARQLNSDGLSFSSEETISLLKLSLSWEDGFMYVPWYIRRGNYHYLIYSGNCDGGVGVARSSHALGPYEKLANPIIKPNSIYGCTADASVIKDLDEKNDLVVFNGLQYDIGYVVLLASISWSPDDWPLVEDFKNSSDASLKKK